jgi:hypothetical protein
MADIELPKEDDIFFDKDHIIFYTDESGEIKCKYSLVSKEIFQDLILSILSGAINEGILDFLIEDLSAQNFQEESIGMLVVKKLLQKEARNPIIKPSNFK